MPPPVMTKVMPMLTTPTMAARRRIVIALSTLANRSPAVNAPTRQITRSATTSPRLRPNGPLINAAARDGPPLSVAACSPRTVSLDAVAVSSTPVVLCLLMRRFLP